MSAIITTGELLIDFTPVKVPGYNDLVCKNPGGAPANVAVELARMGVSVEFIGKVGQDDFGVLLSNCLQQNKVGVNNLVFDTDYRTTLAFVQLNEQGDRSFTFYRNPGADTQLRLDEIDLSCLEDCTILHFGSLSLTNEPSRSTTLELVKLAKARGCYISYDPNWREPLWPSLEVGIAAMQSGLGLCDILKISLEEMELLSGQADIQTAIASLHQYGIRLIIVTLGPDGCIFSCNGQMRHVPTFDTKVVDTTGSGDSFWGAILYQLYINKSVLEQLTPEQLQQYCCFANAAGAVCASQPGGIPAMPTISIVEDCLQRTPELKTSFVL